MTFASFPDRPDLQRGVQEEVEGDPEDTPNSSLRFQTRYKHVFPFFYWNLTNVAQVWMLVKATQEDLPRF